MKPPRAEEMWSPTLRLALWTRWAAENGRSLGKRLRSLDWHSAALSGRRSR